MVSDNGRQLATLPLPGSNEDPDIEHALLSDVGMRRANNQDSAAVLICDSEDRRHRRGHLFVVADGMGAHAAGELASKMAVEQIPHHYFRSSDLGPSEALRKAIQGGNAEIHLRGQQNPEFHNMGTTASSLALLPDGALVGHVGDSRVYRLRKQVLEQLTFDHSLVWEMEAAGQLKGDAVLSNSIPKNVITRSLGPSPEVMVDIEGPLPLAKDDTFLLCSDGLTGQVDDVEIGVILNCLSPERACRVLVDLANLRGGPDNITVIVVKVGEEEIGSASSSTQSASSSVKVSAPLAATTAACFLAAGLFALLGSWPPAIGAGAVGILAGILMLIGMSKGKSIAEPTANVPRSSTCPYRRYKCSDSSDLLKKLTGTVAALRDASVEKNWHVHWDVIEKLESDAKAIADTNSKEAVKLQAEAIIATMEQLREQHRRQASDSTLDF